MQQPRIGSKRKSKKDAYTIFDTEMESTSPKSEQDSGILDVEDEEDEEVTDIWTGEVRPFLNVVHLRCEFFNIIIFCELLVKYLGSKWILI